MLAMDTWLLLSLCALRRCHNYTAHLGRWAVPISLDTETLVCGIDGCF